MAPRNWTKTAYRHIMGAVAVVLGVEKAKKIDAKYRFGRELDLDHPRTLADKVSWLELNTDRSLESKLTDKIEVRSYVANKGLNDLLIPVVGGPWSDVKQIELDVLPEQFVLKAAHGCEMNLICKDKQAADFSRMFKLASQWLKEDYPRACLEPHYKPIPHRVYAEAYMGGSTGLTDYKFYCLNGEPAFILACSERESGVKLNLYDLHWSPIDGVQGKKKNEGCEIPKPSSLNRMLDVAKILAEGFDFVRVDLYETEGEVYFGELTFTPSAGIFPNFTDDFVAEWGDRLSLTAKAEEG